MRTMIFTAIFGVLAMLVLLQAARAVSRDRSPRR
jgi:hypothetical protein